MWYVTAGTVVRVPVQIKAIHIMKIYTKLYTVSFIVNGNLKHIQALFDRIVFLNSITDQSPKLYILLTIILFNYIYCILTYTCICI